MIALVPRHGTKNPIFEVVAHGLIKLKYGCYPPLFAGMQVIFFCFVPGDFHRDFVHVHVHNELVPSIVNSCRIYRFLWYLKRYIGRAVYWKIVFPAARGINFFLLCQRAIVSSLVCINVDSFVIICHNLDSGKTLQNIYYLWTNMAEIWPTYFRINFLKNRFWEFWVLFSVLVIFFPGCANDLLILALSAYTLYQKKKPLDKSLRHSLLTEHVKKQMRS